MFMFYAFVLIAVYTVRRVDICSFLELIAENTSGNCYCLLAVDVFWTLSLQRMCCLIAWQISSTYPCCIYFCQWLHTMVWKLSLGCMFDTNALHGGPEKNCTKFNAPSLFSPVCSVESCSLHQNARQRLLSANQYNILVNDLNDFW